MKMEHVVAADRSGVVTNVAVAVGDTVQLGDGLVVLDDAAVAGVSALPVVHAATEAAPGLRPDLADVIERHAMTTDARRPDAVARRRATGQRTARENVEDLCDPGTFVEYGSLVIAAQRRRRDVQELIERTPADGLVGGIGKVGGHPR